MTRSIYKYRLPELATPASFELVLPERAQVLDFGEDLEGKLCLWAWIDPGAPDSKRTFALAWTGTSIEGEWALIDRAVHGGLIWWLLEQSSGAALFGAAMSGGAAFAGGRLLK